MIQLSVRLCLHSWFAISRTHPPNSSATASHTRLSLDITKEQGKQTIELYAKLDRTGLYIDTERYGSQPGVQNVFGQIASMRPTLVELKRNVFSYSMTWSKALRQPTLLQPASRRNRPRTVLNRSGTVLNRSGTVLNRSGTVSLYVEPPRDSSRL